MQTRRGLTDANQESQRWLQGQISRQESQDRKDQARRGQRAKETKGWILMPLDLDNLTGMETALLGVCYRMGQPFLVYDRGKVMQELEFRGLTSEEAELQYKVLSHSWLGDHTPGFVEELSAGHTVN